MAINCMDEERLTPDDVIQLRERTAEVAPFTDAGNGIAQGARDGCEFWPAEPTLGITYAQDIEGTAEGDAGLQGVIRDSGV